SFLPIIPQVTVMYCAFRLSECNMTVKGCSALLEALRSESSTLRELNLSKNRIQDSGVKLLSAELKKKNCKLETV
ncbi:NACHT, LRR and PYD domains-containing protein 12-like, partial [Silurus meridionalis]